MAEKETQAANRGAICLACEEDGPCLVIEELPDDLPDDLNIMIEFTCGECGRQWQWSYLPQEDIYRFIREVQPKEES